MAFVADEVIRVVSGHKIRSNTLRKHASSLAEVARLAVCPSRILQHTHNEPELAQQTMLPWAISRDMRLCYSPYWHAIVQDLDQRVRIRVEDMRLQAAVFGLVVEAGFKV